MEKRYYTTKSFLRLLFNHLRDEDLITALRELLEKSVSYVETIDGEFLKFSLNNGEFVVEDWPENEGI